MNQLTLSLEGNTVERFPSLREYIAHRSLVVSKLPKAQAADMDLSPSTLSRKLHPHEGDTQRFNCDDLEAWLASTGDAHAVIEYIAAKFLDSDEARKARAVARLEMLANDLTKALASLKGSQ